METTRIIISGAGAAGTAITKFLHAKGAQNLIVCDSKGIISSSNNHSPFKKQLAQITNRENKTGTLVQALIKSDVFIGVSRPGIVTSEMVKSMNTKAIVISMANPIPEIIPEEAKQGGAYIVATGRSDYPNQINNALVFPGVFRGALDHNVKTITTSMLLNAAENLASLVENPTPEYIIPSIFDKRVVKEVAKAIIDL